ncbi:hypothetical protein PAECIP111893_04144 [Paenibacillus plantiphilus]|uniref:Schlafen AlbA-2 domain-containing protein n=1 Tax=Paenibacillus plantiphilus TaxID=2905650 RepID=A0ABN8GX60_9BACL|nr:ATP-binding protein [Paenibacillus plantiphilus]CAH1216511.1 hypothetical protein PAECIP111893_04144 [Paenibacillus plantiphilus]
MNIEQIQQRLVKFRSLELRLELHSNFSAMELMRIVVRNTDSLKETEVYNYGQVIFIQHHVSGEHLSQIIEQMKKQGRFSFETPDFCEIIECKHDLSKISFDERKLSSGQWNGIQSNKLPCQIIQSSQEIDHKFNQLTDRSINKSGLLYFPTLRDAEFYYLYDTFAENNNTLRSFFQLIIFDERAWFERILVNKYGLQVSVAGEEAGVCELKLFGKRPGIARVVALSKNTMIDIPLDALSAELYVYLSLNNEVLDTRYIAEGVFAFAPTADVVFEQDEQFNIEGVIMLRGEGIHHDYKQAYTDKIPITMCAFANAEGGSVFVGIDDDGKVVGVVNGDDLRLKVENWWEDNAIGKVDRRYVFHPLFDEKGIERTVVEIRVEEAKTKPIAIRKNNGQETYYMRRDGSNRPMRRDDFVHLIQLSSRNSDSTSLIIRK